MDIQAQQRTAKIVFNALCISALYACGGSGTSSSDGSPVVQALAQATGPALAGPIVLEDGTSVGAEVFPKGATASGAQGQVIQGISCSKPMKSSLAYGYAHLNLMVDGQQIAVPEGIGLVIQGNPGIIDPVSKEIGCDYPIITSDSSGKIRLRGGNTSPYTLGQFFALWGQPLDSSNVAGYKGKPVKVFVKDGVNLAEYSENLALLPLTPNREITIQIGSALGKIPNFEWNNPPPLSAAPVAIKRGDNGPSNGQVGLEDNLFNNKGGQGGAVDGLLCYGPKNQNQFKELYHAHSHLAIFKDGVRLAIPPYIGIVGNEKVANTFCAYPLHSHDSTGTIHIEPVDNTTLTLGQFFKIWGQPLDRTNVAGQTNKPVVIYVQDGGNLRKYQGDPATVNLKSYRSIVIQIGTPLAEIPTFDLVDEIQ